MGNDIKYMLIKVTMYDCIIGVIITLVTSLVSKEYVLPAVLGLIVASATFVFSGIITSRSLEKNKPNSLFLLSYIIKIIVICGIGMMLSINNKYNVIAYMMGFISHFAALVGYGISIKDN